MKEVEVKRFLLTVTMLVALTGGASAEANPGPNPSCLQWNEAGWGFFGFLPLLEGYVIGRNDVERIDFERYETEFGDHLKRYCKAHPEERFLHGAREAYDAILRIDKAAQADEATILKSLPVDVQKDIGNTRTSCIEQGANLRAILQAIRDDSGLMKFTLSGDVDAVLVNDGELCGGERIKGANCHTGGCDVTIYARIRGAWRKVLDGRSGAFVSVDWRSRDSRLLTLVVNLAGDDPGCPVREANVRAYGGTAWKRGQCDVIARWDGGKFVYRMLQ